MARSIKFSDDTFLDASGVVKGQKTLDSMLGTSLGSFSQPTLEDFLKSVMVRLYSDNYPFFIGSATLVGFDQFTIFYANALAIISTHNLTYVCRYENSTSISIYKVTTTVE